MFQIKNKIIINYFVFNNVLYNIKKLYIYILFRVRLIVFFFNNVIDSDFR